MREGTDSKWVIHGREENMTIHDEGGMRHFYSEWSKKMNRQAFNPMGDNKLTQAA
jgi:methanesulfonate monooxygenase large subunit